MAMHLQLLTTPQGPIIAYEWIDHIKHGIFHLTDNGQVYYRYEDTPARMVNSNLMCFKQCVELWGDYQLKLKRSDDDAVQQTHADHFSDHLKVLDPAVRMPDSFWSVVLEQVEDGFL